jgi:hypothetical protein
MGSDRPSSWIWPAHVGLLMTLLAMVVSRPSWFCAGEDIGQGSQGGESHLNGRSLR